VLSAITTNNVNIHAVNVAAKELDPGRLPYMMRAELIELSRENTAKAFSTIIIRDRGIKSDKN
jgi:hypothetical protein